MSRMFFFFYFKTTPENFGKLCLLQHHNVYATTNVHCHRLRLGLIWASGERATAVKVTSSSYEKKLKEEQQWPSPESLHHAGVRRAFNVSCPPSADPTFSSACKAGMPRVPASDVRFLSTEASRRQPTRVFEDSSCTCQRHYSKEWQNTETRLFRQTNYKKGEKKKKKLLHCLQSLHTYAWKSQQQQQQKMAQQHNSSDCHYLRDEPPI